MALGAVQDEDAQLPVVQSIDEYADKHENPLPGLLNPANINSSFESNNNFSKLNDGQQEADSSLSVKSQSVNDEAISEKTGLGTIQILADSMPKIVPYVLINHREVGLKGEALSLDSLTGSSSVEWMQGLFVSRRHPLTWYKTTFDAQAGSAPLALDMASMGKGQIWINGQSLGRYWPAYKASGSCGSCDYAGTYNEKRCASNCGEPSQRWYRVPRSWLKPSENLLVVFEEMGGDPNRIFLVRRDIINVCADIYEWQPNLVSYHMESSGKVSKPVRPKAHLSCGFGQKISSIKFASFGTSVGSCGNYRERSCHAHKSYDAFQKSCIGQNSCAVIVAPELFGGDPCPNVMKKLSVEAICT